jgi:SlyX protein
MDARLTELEIRYMRQERTIETLSETVYRQGLEIDRLRRDVEGLRDQLRETNRSGGVDPGEEPPPPHY